MRGAAAYRDRLALLDLVATPQESEFLDFWIVAERRVLEILQVVAKNAPQPKQPSNSSARQISEKTPNTIAPANA